jgi:prevent-host-death family protein
METVNIYEAKAKLSKLISQAAAGDDVIIGRNGKPVARLTQIEEKKRVIRFGLLKGKIKIAKDFDEPLPDEIIAAFQGR